MWNVWISFWRLYVSFQVLLLTYWIMRSSYWLFPVMYYISLITIIQRRVELRFLNFKMAQWWLFKETSYAHRVDPEAIPLHWGCQRIALKRISGFIYFYYSLNSERNSITSFWINYYNICHCIWIFTLNRSPSVLNPNIAISSLWPLPMFEFIVYVFSTFLASK